MNHPPVKIYLEGLNALDAEELEEALQKQGLELIQPETPDGTIAEPTTIGVILTLGSFSMVNLAIWLSKKRRRRTLKKAFKIIHPDGTVEERSWTVDDSSEDAVKSGVIAQLGKWLITK